MGQPGLMATLRPRPRATGCTPAGAGTPHFEERVPTSTSATRWTHCPLNAIDIINEKKPSHRRTDRVATTTRSGPVANSAPTDGHPVGGGRRLDAWAPGDWSRRSMTSAGPVRKDKSKQGSGGKMSKLTAAGWSPRPARRDGGQRCQANVWLRLSRPARWAHLRPSTKSFRRQRGWRSRSPPADRRGPWAARPFSAGQGLLARGITQVACTFAKGTMCGTSPRRRTIAHGSASTATRS